MKIYLCLSMSFLDLSNINILLKGPVCLGKYFGWFVSKLKNKILLAVHS